MQRSRVISKWLALVMLMLILFSSSAQAKSRGGSVYVHGYYRKNGTYVQPHYRSAPDGNPYNNWSYPGNVNPYTGVVAPGNPETYLFNYYSHASETTNSGHEDGASTGVEKIVSRTITPKITVYDYPVRAEIHMRGIDNQSSYVRSRSVVGYFKNTTDHTMHYSRAKLYLPGSDGQPYESTSTYLTPNFLLPGEVGYFTLTSYALSSWDSLGVGVESSPELDGLSTPHTYPLSNLTFQVDRGLFTPTIKVTGTLTNDTSSRIAIARIDIVLVDGDGYPVGTAMAFVSDVEPRKSSVFETTAWGIQAEQMDEIHQVKATSYQ